MSTFRDIEPLLRLGDEAAADQVFNRYVDRLVRLAESRINVKMKAKFDADDVVQSVFRSFFRRQQSGEFAISDWHSLWSLLATIAIRKCARRQARYYRQKRNVRREAKQEISPNDNHETACLTRIASSEPGPSEVAALEEIVHELMEALDPGPRQLVVMKLQGYTNEEISMELGRSERTVYRILQGVRVSLANLETELREGSGGHA